MTLIYDSDSSAHCGTIVNDIGLALIDISCCYTDST